MTTIKEYRKDNLTITWEPKKCIHAGICVDQIDACPSGALGYKES